VVRAGEGPRQTEAALPENLDWTRHQSEKRLTRAILSELSDEWSNWVIYAVYFDARRPCRSRLVKLRFGLNFPGFEAIFAESVHSFS
jgi:hypothetical protein